MNEGVDRERRFGSLDEIFMAYMPRRYDEARVKRGEIAEAELLVEKLLREFRNALVSSRPRQQI